MKSMAMAVVALACCTAVQAQALNKSQNEPLLKTIALTSSAAAQTPDPERVEPPAWFKDETLKATIAAALPPPFNMGKFDGLKDYLTWHHEHGLFLGGAFINPKDGRTYNYTTWIHPDGGLTMVLPDTELRIEPTKGKWGYFLLKPDPGGPTQDSQAAPATQRVEPPAWFKDKVLLRTIGSYLTKPLDNDLWEVLASPLTWPRPEGHFLRRGYIDPTDQRTYNLSIFISKFGGVTVVLPHSELRIEPYQGKWYYFPSDSRDSSIRSGSGDIPQIIEMTGVNARK